MEKAVKAITNNSLKLAKVFLQLPITQFIPMLLSVLEPLHQVILEEGVTQRMKNWDHVFLFAIALRLTKH